MLCDTIGEAPRVQNASRLCESTHYHAELTFGAQYEPARGLLTARETQ